MRGKRSQGNVSRISMRPIGQLDTEEQARTFADYLFIRDIDAQVEPGKGNV